jgi:HlyD family secretion protein
MAESSLFRKAAIDKVSSPEQLDLLMRVTSPVGWLALLTVAVMLCGVGVWSVLGSIPDLVDGSGTLFRGERIYDVKATIGGSVLALNVQPGNLVVAGQAIAKIKREVTSTEQQKAAAEQVRAANAQVLAYNDQLTANLVTIGKNRAQANRYQDQLKTLESQRQMQKQLVDQGIKTPKDLLSIERDMDGVRGNIDSLLSEARQLEARSEETKAQIRTAQATITSTQLGLTSTAEVTSAESGQIVEVIKSAGDKVLEGEPLIRIQRRSAEASQICGGDVHALIYVPAGAAGKIKKGQFVRVSPSDVKKEEYGFIFGKVEWVASYPSSTVDMTEKLKNDQLVKQFMTAGPVFETRVCLEKNPSNPVKPVNPFKWSSSLGPPKGTEAGTTCVVSIIVDEKRPYTYVIPAVRRAVGL